MSHGRSGGGLRVRLREDDDVAEILGAAVVGGRRWIADRQAHRRRLEGIVRTQPVTRQFIVYDVVHLVSWR